jgi:hypothetical protein
VAAYLVQFADDALTVERARRTFHAFDTFGAAGLEIQTPSGSSMHVAEQDIRTLAQSVYIHATNFNTSGTFDSASQTAGCWPRRSLEVPPTPSRTSKRMC